MSYDAVEQYIGLLLKNKRPPEIGALSTGFWVRLLHRLLAWHGYLSASYLDAETPVPNAYDVVLQGAIEMFQRKCGLVPDGICDAQTWAWLACKDMDSVGERTLVYARLEFLEHAREFGGNNKGEYIEKYLRGTGLQGVAWCVAFATWCAIQANGGKKVWKERLSSSRLIKEAKKTDRFRHSSQNVRPGDIVVLSGGPTGWKHTVLLQRIEGQYAYVIEGNVRGGDTDEPRYRLPGSRDAVRHGRYALNKVAFVLND